jgi:hypothetical protein
MRKVIISLFFVISLLLFGYVAYVLGEYIYLKTKLGQIEKKISEYANIPYLNRQLEMYKSEYTRVQNIKENTKTPALVISEITKILKRRNIKILSISQSSEEEEQKGTFIIIVESKFTDFMLALSEIENSFLPMNISYIYIKGNSENLRVKMSVFILNT